MAAKCLTIVLSAVLGAGPAAGAPPVPPVARPAVGQPPVASTMSPAEARYPFDAPDPWLHGYIQEVPPYGGFNAFRPYNYKHVLAQSQIAAECGHSATAPYSHQFWQRYQARANTDDGIGRSVPVPEAPQSKWQPQPSLISLPVAEPVARATPLDDRLDNRPNPPTSETIEKQSAEPTATPDVVPSAAFITPVPGVAFGRATTAALFSNMIEQWPHAPVVTGQGPSGQSPGGLSENSPAGAADDTFRVIAQPDGATAN